MSFDNRAKDLIKQMLQIMGELAASYEEAWTLAITDEQTGLANRRLFEQRLQEEIQRAERYNRGLTLVMLDIDDFKLYNDTHGHLAGDKMLAAIAAVLKENVRSIDLAARYGGEEFALILPETDQGGAFTIMERVRQLVENSPAVEVTVSAGIATYPRDGVTREELIHSADQALYQAKAAGKNRIAPLPSGNMSLPRSAPNQAGELSNKQVAVGFGVDHVTPRSFWLGGEVYSISHIHARLALGPGRARYVVKTDKGDFALLQVGKKWFLERKVDMARAGNNIDRASAM
ncbi:MAG: GGDEF domain-containing protein [Syntrophothermus sp.]